MLIVDSHEDLAWNMATFDRDYTRSAAETRRLEQGTPIAARNGDTLLGWPDYQRGQVAVVFGTLFATPQRANTGDWDTQCYRTFTQAHQLYRAQLDSYHRLFDLHPEQFRPVLTRRDLQAVLAHWENAAEPAHPVGLVTLMEGAEGVQAPDELAEWWQGGVRLIGPAWTGTRYCGGTREPGPLTKDGYALLEVMAELGFVLDLSHMDEKAALQALEAYPGRIVATHANALALLKGTESNRFLSDRLIHGLLERGGIIGVVPFNKFLQVGWELGDRRDAATLTHLVAHIDYICQLAGGAQQVGLGTDFDGGFGWQHVPVELDTIADLHKLAPLLAARGYAEADIAAIFGQNWLRLLNETLPEAV
jgi:membrane dipeptidase